MQSSSFTERSKVNVEGTKFSTEYKHQDNMTSHPKKWCKEQKLLKGVSTIMIGFKKKTTATTQSLFPRCVLMITVGNPIEICCGGDKI